MHIEVENAEVGNVITLIFREGPTYPGKMLNYMITTHDYEDFMLMALHDHSVLDFKGKTIQDLVDFLLDEEEDMDDWERVETWSIRDRLNYFNG